MEVLQTLGIDWQLLLAQMINFGIVLFILAKFVYRPLMKAIDSRREEIVKSMAEADELKRLQAIAEEKRQDILRGADREAGTIVEKAKIDAEKLRADIVAKAHIESEQIIKNGEKVLEDERNRVFHEVQDTVASSIITVSERILRREFSAADQKRLLSDLQKELPTLLHS